MVSRRNEWSCAVGVEYSEMELIVCGWSEEKYVAADVTRRRYGSVKLGVMEMFAEEMK